MAGSPVKEAVRGARQFVAEGLDAAYEVGVILWNTDVVGLAMPSREASPSLEVLERARGFGGNNLLVPLQCCDLLLQDKTGDRVVAIFGDGDLTPKSEVLRQVATMRSRNIRFVTRGLGPSAAKEFGEIDDEGAARVLVDNVDGLAAGIAGMAKVLKNPGIAGADQ